MDTARCIVFLGPTLSAEQAQALMAVEVRPPAAQGDVYRAARERPLAIGIVDGVFHNVPAVWHKEILWALDQGIHVFGAASMGALRAAELHDFGMVGIGGIFEDYRDGVLEADDEVALLHGPAESGWLALSEPLVDIRATLDAAQAAGVLDGQEATRLLAHARKLHYPDRRWETLLGPSSAQALAVATTATLRDWLPSGRVQRKRDDAVAMLKAMKHWCASGPTPFVPDFHFEDTLYWTRLQAQIDAEVPPLTEENRRVLSALNADRAAAEAAAAGALGWMLAGDWARACGREADAAALLATSRDFCARHGIASEAEVDAWLVAHVASREDLHRMLTLRCHAEATGASNPERLEQAMVDYLRWSGTYRRLLDTQDRSDDR